MVFPGARADSVELYGGTNSGRGGLGNAPPESCWMIRYLISEAGIWGPIKHCEEEIESRASGYKQGYTTNPIRLHRAVVFR